MTDLYLRGGEVKPNKPDIRILKSADEIFEAQENGELTIAQSNVVINSPAIVK